VIPNSNEPNSAQEKAFHINRDAQVLGTFAEIGAGQEVARWFFQAGKASATLAKSISAYDMAVSDSLYGPTAHYVSRARLEAMLDLEYAEAVARLGAKHGETTRLFAFADTVATRTSRRSQAGHGWMGVRFQTEPGAEPSEVIIHIEMLDILTVSQQEAVGLVGVNLLFAAFYLRSDPGASIGTLLDGLDRHRLAIDMIRFSGPGFDGVDNRLMSLQLVERGLADAVMFTERGEVVQPAEVLWGKAVLIERGSFRPLTNVTREMLDRAREQLQTDFPPADRVVLMEMTLNNLKYEGKIDHSDFLARVGMLGALGYMVMISNYTRFDLVTPYLRAYTREHIGMVAGIPTLLQILDEKYYAALPGGLLEGLGGLFRGLVKLLVYPTMQPGSGEIVTADTVEVAPNLKHLYAHLRENGFIEPIRTFDAKFLSVTPAEVLAKIQSGDASWESAVPPEVFQAITNRKLFGYRAAR
jgi:hypothetical protein